MYRTGLPGAGLEGVTDFKIRSSSDTNIEADAVSDIRSGDAVPTVPSAIVFVNDIGTFGVCAVAIKLVVNVHVSPAAIVVLPVCVIPRSLTVRAKVPAIPAPEHIIVGMPVVFRPYAKSPTPSIGLSVKELITIGVSPKLEKLTPNVSVSLLAIPELLNDLLIFRGDCVRTDADALDGINPNSLLKFAIPLIVLFTELVRYTPLVWRASTSTTIVHDCPAAIVADVALIETAPATGLNVAGVPPPVHVDVALGGVATFISAPPPPNKGNVSVISTFGKLTTLGLLITIVRFVAFPFKIRVELENDLLIVGTGMLSTFTL